MVSERMTAKQSVSTKLVKLDLYASHMDSQGTPVTVISFSQYLIYRTVTSLLLIPYVQLSLHLELTMAMGAEPGQEQTASTAHISCTTWRTYSHGYRTGRQIILVNLWHQNHEVRVTE